MSSRSLFVPTIVFTLFALFSMPFLRSARASDGQDAKKVSPAAQARIDELVKDFSKWTEEAALVGAVVEQNAKGPLADMTEAKWKETKRRSPLVEGFQTNPAGALLKKKAGETNGLVSEAFLSAAQGEKVAFLEKTSNYIHKGKAKFDVPFTTKKNWQGEPSFDESTQTYSVQVSMVVLEPKKEGAADADRKPIGVLTLGLNLTQLEESVKGK
jgi:hypothetical protein